MVEGVCKNACNECGVERITGKVEAKVRMFVEKLKVLSKVIFEYCANFYKKSIEKLRICLKPLQFLELFL